MAAGCDWSCGTCIVGSWDHLSGWSIQKDVPGSFKLASRPSGSNEQQPIRTTAQQLPVSPATNPTSGTANPAAGTATASNAGGNGQVAPISATSNAAGTDRPINKPRVTVSKQKTEGSEIQPAVVSTVVADSPATASTILHREAVHRTDAVQSQPVDDHEGLKTALANQILGWNK